MTTRFLTVLAVLAIAFTASAAGAQVTTTGTVSVVVTDPDGGRVPGVTVTASAPDVVTTRTAVTDGEGVASLEALAPSSLYTITSQLSGFRDLTRENILVRSGQTTTLYLTLALATQTETVTVTAEATPVVDVTRATTGQDITLQLTESLPTGRSYQSYLQLVPGVSPDNPVSGSGNPAARAGLNYADVQTQGTADNIGVSADNAYYFDGINVTDPVRGTFGANLNTEIIQEQKVITGGIPAEYVGVPGLISNVITKSGSNTFHGSANYFFQNSGLVAENKNGPSEEFSTKDTAFTIGGPALRDKAWFFGSFRYLTREDDVSTLDTNQFLRTVERTDKQGFAKGTWAPTQGDLISFTYLSDPTDISGRREREITNARDRSREQGGNRYSANYTKVLGNGNTLFELGYNHHQADISDFSTIRETRNDIIFRGTDTRTLTEEQLGGFGRDLPEERNTSQFRASVQHAFGRHTIKGGFEFTDTQNLRDVFYISGANYESLSNRYAGAGITAGQIAAGGFSILAFDSSNTSDYTGFISTINGRPDRQQFYNAFDTNGDGTISQAELGANLVFNSTAGNPHGQLNYDRTAQSELGAQDTGSHGYSFFVQDEFNAGNFTFNLGLRSERWAHFATNGDNIYTFDWEWAPRLSAVYDLNGDGRQKLSAFWGRYYDPPRNNLTNFAGTLNGSVLEEQVFALGQWITYRTRGGATVQDAFFAPTTQTPYTDDLQFSYGIDLGMNQSFEAIFWKRNTRDIIEDYDHHLYGFLPGTPGAAYPGPIDHPQSLFLGPQYFGYDVFPESNFFIATLEGGERNFHGLELAYRKRFADNWQALVSYNWLDGEGNSNSDSDADFQGDVIWLDPRAPNQYARQPGVISHLFKGAASYSFPMGLQLGATFRWNSGVYSNRTFRASGRNLPNRVAAADAFEFAGITTRWIEPGAVGGYENPSWGSMDLRIQYQRNVGAATAEMFVDLFDVFNHQAAIREQDLVLGLGGTPFGAPTLWVLPARSFIGFRVRF